MTNLNKTTPKHFWRHINSYRKGKKAAAQGITTEELAEHFKNLSNSIDPQQNFDGMGFENPKLRSWTGLYPLVKFAKQ